MPTESSFARPYVVSWNLTYRCNLACEHCYLDAGGKPQVETAPSPTAASSAPRSASGSSTRSPPSRPRPDDPDRRRAAAAPRHPRDRPARRRARPLGRRRHERRADHREPGARLRGGACAACRSRSTRSTPIATTASGACAAPGDNTVEGARDPRPDAGLPFIVQTTVGRAQRSASSTRSPTSPTTSSAPRSGTCTSWCRPAAASSSRTSRPAQYDDVLAATLPDPGEYAGRMLVNAKCAPHYVQTL